MSEINKTLAERGSTHGSFKDGAEMQVNILRAMRILPPRSHLSDSQIAVWLAVSGKQSRAVIGNPNFIDNYRDVAGYAELEVDILKNTEGALDVMQQYQEVRLENEEKM